MCKRGDLSFGHKQDFLAMSVRSRQPGCTCSNQPGSTKRVHCVYMVPKMSHGNQEVLRRALTRPPKRIDFRCLNFRPWFEYVKLFCKHCNSDSVNVLVAVTTNFTVTGQIVTESSCSILSGSALAITYVTDYTRPSPCSTRLNTQCFCISNL
ncbi:hypothetical protein VNO78_06406 [Psophocarpus tetragonolobus]|uniref:Uncharacterized protein n=1 Tax=Psophocarpus tetragonolobus TaxID=3891 RepID=A0AAN9T201_PSOTE